MVRWKRSRLERVLGYRIYRKTNDTDYIAIGTATAPPFLDKDAPAGAVSYAVSALASGNSESKLSKPTLIPH